MTDAEYIANIESVGNDELIDNLFFYGHDHYYNDLWDATVREICNRLGVLEGEKDETTMLPCPICGGAAELVELDYPQVYVRCSRGCIEQSKIYRMKGTAKRAWNRRANIEKE